MEGSSSARAFDWIVMVGLASLLTLAIARGVALSRRGVRLFPIDRERTPRQALADLGFLLGFLLFIGETLAFAVPLDFQLAPAAIRGVVLPSLPMRLLGALALAGGVVVYARALAAFGTSWRFTIDRVQPGELVTGGIFSRTRNPIYLALILVAVGVALALGRGVLLLLAFVAPLYFHHLIAREEQFLRRHYGDAYAAYAARVGRWWTWHR